MRVLVTGGAGFIGSNTVDALVAAAHNVAVLDDLSSGKLANLNPAARFHKADLRDGARVKDVVDQERPELIYHLAAQMDVRRSVADPQFDAQVNLLGMLNLMEAARVSGVRRIIFSSTGGAIYGEQQSFPCDEDHPCRPVSPYGVAKLATERYLYFYQHEYGLSYTALRYANVYGPRQDPHGEAGVVAIFSGRLLRDETCTIYGDGGQTRDYIFVGDVVAANLAVLARPVEGAFNVGTGIETDVNQLYAEMAALAGRNQLPRHQPPRPGEQRRSVISPQRAQTELNWHPRTALRQGLARTLEFFRRGGGGAQ